MKQSTISNVNVGFELLVEALGHAVDEIPTSSISAKRAVSCCKEKIAETLDCWKAIVGIHCLDNNEAGKPEAEVNVATHEKIEREHDHWGYDPCPLRVVIDGKDFLPTTQMESEPTSATHGNSLSRRLRRLARTGSLRLTCSDTQETPMRRS